jgi:hypothetical protein
MPRARQVADIAGIALKDAALKPGKRAFSERPQEDFYAVDVATAVAAIEAALAAGQSAATDGAAAG